MGNFVSNNTNNKQAYIIALITVAIWASAFPASRYALEHYSPMTLMLLRFIFASGTLIVIGLIKKIRLPQKKDILKFLGAGFVGIFLYMLFFNLGVVTVVSGVASFIVASSPVWTLIMSGFFLKEKVGLLSWIGISISFLGLVIVMLTQLAEFAMSIGVVLILLSAFSTGVHSLVQRSFLKNYTALEATTYSIVAATIFMLIFIPGMITEIPGTPIYVNLLVIYLGVVPAALGYLCWGFALSKAEKIANVAVFLYLIPFAASILAFFWLGETFSLLSLLGGVIIISGMFVSNFMGKKDNR